ncbi:MAG: leucine-rich repeat domain-containing protein [Clostridia bacterium]|nr:leucine-rich repeat domain-containing protein [Clostridia bacterium]
MKRYLKYFAIALSLIFVFLPILLGGSNAYAKSYTLSADDYGRTIELGTDISDTELYSMLGHRSRSFTRGSVRTKTFADIVYLDLSGEANTNKKIKSLNGLDNLDFSGVKVLRLDYNNISNITAKELQTFTHLETLIIRNCNLESIDLSGLEHLRYLDLSGNKITSIKLNKMIVNTELEYTKSAMFHFEGSGNTIVWIETKDTTTYVNLSNNYITNLSDINLPEDKEGCVVDLYNNGIVGYENTFEHMILNLGLQGLSSNHVYTETTDDDTHNYVFISTKLYYMPVNDDSIKFVLSRAYTENGEAKEETIEISNATYPQATQFTLGVGAYTLKVYKNDVEDYESEITNNYKALAFDAIPTTPQHVYVINGKTYIELSSIDEVTYVNFTADEGAEIYYRFDSEENWTKGNSVKLTKGGYHSLYVKAVLGDYESKTKLIMLDGAANLYIPSILVIVIVVAIMLLFAFVLLPLIRKYIIKA